MQNQLISKKSKPVRFRTFLCETAHFAKKRTNIFIAENTIIVVIGERIEKKQHRRGVLHTPTT